MPDVKHFDVNEVLDDVMRLFWRQGPSATGIQAVVSATGVSRSSLYSTFGGKNSLYVAALRRYVERHSVPAFARLASSTSGLPAIEAFFAALIRQRCAGGYAGWGCMVTNAHAGPESSDPHVRDVLNLHHQRLREALRSALATAARRGQFSDGAGGGVDLDAMAGVLAVLAYGVNLRSRAGADADVLHAEVSAVLKPLRVPATDH